VERADEHKLSIKTTAEIAGSLKAFIREHHSYELPEMIVTPIIGGTDDYLEWIHSETGQRNNER
jgi:periplasmic divalent cation tolerance protein